jgi:hypothetical protein
MLISPGARRSGGSDAAGSAAGGNQRGDAFGAEVKQADVDALLRVGGLGASFPLDELGRGGDVDEQDVG